MLVVRRPVRIDRCSLTIEIVQLVAAWLNQNHPHGARSHEWFHRRDFEGCSFVNVMLETADAEHPIGRASAEHLENIRSVLRSLAEEAGLRDTDEFARSFHILMKGSIVQAAEGDVEAAKRAQQMAADLIEKYR